MTEAIAAILVALAVIAFCFSLALTYAVIGWLWIMVGGAPEDKTEAASAGTVLIAIVAMSVLAKIL